MPSESSRPLPENTSSFKTTMMDLTREDAHRRVAPSNPQKTEEPGVANNARPRSSIKNVSTAKPDPPQHFRISSQKPQRRQLAREAPVSIKQGKKPRNPQADASTHPKRRPVGWHALPDDIDFRITTFLDPLSAVCYTLARYAIHDLPLTGLHLSPPLLCPSSAYNPLTAITRRSSSWKNTHPPGAAQLIRTVSSCMPAQYIFCGRPGSPVFRSLLMAEELMRSYVKHLDCWCATSMAMKEGELVDPRRQPWKLSAREHQALLDILERARRLYAPLGG